MPYQSAVTLLAPLPPGQTERATAALADLAGPGRGALAFEQHADLHFARLLLLDGTDDPDGGQVAPCLLYTADVDGSADAHLRALRRCRARASTGPSPAAPTTPRGPIRRAGRPASPLRRREALASSATAR
jgi:hypothetical protein